MAWKFVLLTVLCFLQAVHGATAADALQSVVSLTADEAAYVAAAGEIKMCVDPDWAPFERINEQGQHEGIAADLIQRVAQQTGLRIALYPTNSWEESLAASQDNRCQILSFLNQTPERERWLSFTAPIFFDPNIIITREEHAYIADLHGARGESVALPRGTMVEELIRKEYPDLTVILTGSEQESVVLVSERKADMTVRSLIVAAFAIKKEGLFNLKISGQLPEFTNTLRVGVVKGAPLLRDILDKGVATLTAQDREAITNKHVVIHVQRGIDYSLVWNVAAGATVLLLVSFFWNRKLAVLNKELNRLSVTDKLTGLFNRLKIDELLESEIRRAQRGGMGQSFGLIMLDVDHFKQVNDVHGHQVGDHVLIDAANLLRGTIRGTDAVGRWGGEEFLILCPQTDEAGTYRVAENLRRDLMAHDFPIVGHKTASFGLTTYRAGDSSKSMVARADRALYTAKRQGRNQVVIFTDAD